MRPNLLNVNSSNLKQKAMEAVNKNRPSNLQMQAQEKSKVQEPLSCTEAQKPQKLGK
jgi:hypothetical protein